MKLNFNLLHKVFRKQRKYPIKRDDTGRSARSRAFELFNNGMRPSKAAPKIGISAKTAYRYYEDWKKYPRNYKQLQAMFRIWSKAGRTTHIEELAKLLDMPVGELTERLEKPWGFRQIAESKLTRNKKERLTDIGQDRLLAALDYVGLSEKAGLTPRQQREIYRRVVEAHRQEIKNKMEKRKKPG